MSASYGQYMFNFSNPFQTYFHVSLTFVLNGSGEFESLHTPTAPGGCQLYVQLLPNRQVAHFDFMTTMMSAIECIYPHCSLCIFFCEMIVYFKYWILRNLYMLCIQGLPVSDITRCMLQN